MSVPAKKLDENNCSSSRDSYKPGTPLTRPHWALAWLVTDPIEFRLAHLIISETYSAREGLWCLRSANQLTKLFSPAGVARTGPSQANGGISERTIKRRREDLQKKGLLKRRGGKGKLGVHIRLLQEHLDEAKQLQEEYRSQYRSNPEGTPETQPRRRDSRVHQKGLPSQAEGTPESPQQTLPKSVTEKGVTEEEAKVQEKDTRRAFVSSPPAKAEGKMGRPEGVQPPEKGLTDNQKGLGSPFLKDRGDKEVTPEDTAVAPVVVDESPTTQAQPEAVEPPAEQSTDTEKTPESPVAVLDTDVDASRGSASAQRVADPSEDDRERGKVLSLFKLADRVFEVVRKRPRIDFTKITSELSDESWTEVQEAIKNLIERRKLVPQTDGGYLTQRQLDETRNKEIANAGLMS